VCPEELGERGLFIILWGEERHIIGFTSKCTQGEYSSFKRHQQVIRPVWQKPFTRVSALSRKKTRMDILSITLREVGTRTTNNL